MRLVIRQNKLIQNCVSQMVCISINWHWKKGSANKSEFILTKYKTCLYRGSLVLLLSVGPTGAGGIRSLVPWNRYYCTKGIMTKNFPELFLAFGIRYEESKKEGLSSNIK